jgi:hypothetical protein
VQETVRSRQQLEEDNSKIEQRAARYRKQLGADNSRIEQRAGTSK